MIRELRHVGVRPTMIFVMTTDILFADDNADTREMVSVLLQIAGYKVSVAANEAEVLGTLSEESFDAVVLDNWMPEITGLEICKLSRLVEPDYPFFFCSGAVSPSD